MKKKELGFIVRGIAAAAAVLVAVMLCQNTVRTDDRPTVPVNTDGSETPGQSAAPRQNQEPAAQQEQQKATHHTHKTTVALTPETAPEEYRVMHEHEYEWQIDQYPTADAAGIMSYRCKVCNIGKYQVPMSAYYVFNKEAVEKIHKAAADSTVEITTRRWISFHKMVLEELAEHPSVSLKVNYLSDAYKGDEMSFTIPAGTDVTDLIDENGYAGFKFLQTKFPRESAEAGN